MADRDLVFTVLGIDRASRTFDKVGQSMDRMGRRATKTLGGVAASSAAAATAVGAAVGGLPAVFAGLGAVAVRENAEVRRSFEDLSETVRTGLAQDAEPMADALVDAAGDIGAAYERLRPQIARAMEVSADHVDTLVGGVTDFAENAMPGMLTAVERADPALRGFRVLLGEAGQGASEFFTILSESSVEAGQGLEHLGGLARGTLTETAELLGQLTGLWAEHGDEVSDVVTRLLGVVNDLGSDALPVMSTGLGVALDVLQGVLSVIEPMSDILGPLVGMWLSLGAAMKAMRGVRSVMSTAATSVDNFADATRRAASQKGVGRMRAAASGVMGMLGGPWGVALSAATLGLSLFAQNSQQAAADQDDLASALRDSNGEFDSQARRAIANSDAYQEVAGAVEQAGLSHGEFIDAIVAGGPALDQLKSRLQGQVIEGRRADATAEGAAASYSDQAIAAVTLLDGIGGLRGMVSGAVGDFERASEASDVLSGSMAGAVPGADALRESLNTLANQTATTADRADALNTAWRRLFGISLSLEEAQAAFEGGLDDIAESLGTVQEETANWQGQLLKSDGTINVATEAGRKLSEQLIAQGEDYRELAQTAYDSALKRTGSEQQATEAAVAASRKRYEQFVNEMTQMGFNDEQARKLAQRYLDLPDTVLTLIEADASGAQAAVNRFIRNNNGRVVGIRIQAGRYEGGFRTSSGRIGFADGGLVGYADGGQVQRFPGGGRVRGPGGPRQDLVPIMASNGEFVVNAASTRRNLPLLEAINAGRTGGGVAASGGVSAAPQQVQRVVVEFDTTGADEEMLSLIRSMIKVRGGNVQSVLGGR